MAIANVTIARLDSTAPSVPASARANGESTYPMIYLPKMSSVNVLGICVGRAGIFQRRGWRRPKSMSRYRDCGSGVERHGPGAALRGNRVHDGILVRRIFMRHRDCSIAAGRKCQGRGRIEVAGVHTLSDGTLATILPS